MELCPHCGALLPRQCEACPACHAAVTAVEQSALDAPEEMDAAPDQGHADLPAPVPGGLAAGWERLLATPGGRRGARVALSLLLAAALLVVSVAAWHTFVSSAWGLSLRGMNEILFVGGEAQQANAAGGQPVVACITIVGTTQLPRHWVSSDCNASSASTVPADLSVGLPTGQLYVMHPDGSGLRKITHPSDGAFLSPVWSPDGSRIAAFLMAPNADSSAHLAVMDAGGAHLQVFPAVALPLMSIFDQLLIGGMPPVNRLIQWSPDGSQLLAEINAGQFVLINADGTHPRLVVGSQPTWSPDGRYLAYYVHDQPDVAPQARSWQPASGFALRIELLDTHSQQTRQITNLPILNGEALAWSPDGRYLALSAVPQDNSRGSSADSVMIIRPDGTHPQVVMQPAESMIRQIAWSPDSTQLAVVLQPFVVFQPGSTPANASSLWVVALNGSSAREIAPSDASQPSWAPDGKHLVFANPDDTALMIADTIAQPKATVQRVSSTLPALFAPCWSPLAGV
jgi:Tol biopolymer transport system component